MTLNPRIAQQKDLFKNYQEVREQSLRICHPLTTEDYVAQPNESVSPPKWHLGHTTWFFENIILAEHHPEYQLFDEQLNYFFNSYYESLGPRISRSDRGNMTRPSVEKVLEYREYVDQHMSQLLRRHGSEGDLSKDVQYLTVLGLQHEQQHQELLVTDIKYILGHNPLHPVYRSEEDQEPSRAKATETVNFIPFEEGLYEIGYEGEGFCYDNELSRHKVYLHDFAIQDRLVTNGEYLEFVRAGGYRQFQHWLSDGWAWVNEQQIQSPLYWFEQEGQWYEYSLQGMAPLDPQRPVTHISYYEASAFAKWKGLRLPTEAEWEVACTRLYDHIPSGGNFVEQQHFHPVARAGEQDFQMLGNVWEWTGSAYLPYPNYPQLDGALGEYNGKFMVNQMVLRGGSCATPRSHIRMTYRNFFHAPERWQFTGLRLAK